MPENINPQNRVLISSIKIITYTTVILFITVKAVSLLSRPSQATSQQVATNIEPPPVVYKQTPVVQDDNQEDTIIKLKEELQKKNAAMIVNTLGENTPITSSGYNRPHKLAKAKTNLTKLKNNNITKGKDSLHGINQTTKEDKPRNIVQKPTDIEQTPPSQLQKPVDIVQKPSDQGQKQTDAVQKTVNKPVVIDETTIQLPNKSENNKSSPDQGIEFVNQKGKIAINPNVSDGIKDIPVRDKPTETSEILAQFTILAKNGYLKFTGRSKDKVEISTGKKSFWYKVKVGDKIGYIFGFDLTEK